VKDEKAGQIYLPQKYVSGGKPTGAAAWGPTAVGQPPPLVPFVLEYKFPPTPGLPDFTYGRPVYAPAPPNGYTAVQLGASVAFVPADAKATPPSSPPAGFVALKHPK